MTIDYSHGNYTARWHFSDNNDRLSLQFVPFKERVVEIKLGLIDSEVHQIIGHYSGHVVCDDGERIEVKDLVGFAEDHKARW